MADDKNKGPGKLSKKYRLVLLNDETYEKVYSSTFRFKNVIILAATGFLLCFGVCFAMIAYTPLKTFVPGFEDVRTASRLNEILARTDSLEYKLQVKHNYIENVRRILRGEVPGESFEPEEGTTGLSAYEIADSLEKLGINPDMYDKFRVSFDQNFYIEHADFHQPIEGIITESFNPSIGHYATDIVASTGTQIKAVLDGRVVFAEWSAVTGHVIILKHPGNLLTIYKHNDRLLQKVGNFVLKGEPIAVIGESGEYATGPHLHFELWYKGNPLDPEQYFEF